MPPKTNAAPVVVPDDVMAELAKLRAENEALKAGVQSGPISLKLSEKGCISMFGIQSRWPVSLYPEQWEKVFAQVEKVRAFAKANAAELKKRGEASRAAKLEAKATP